jgi:hypothetical protein
MDLPQPISQIIFFSSSLDTVFQEVSRLPALDPYLHQWVTTHWPFSRVFLPFRWTIAATIAVDDSIISPLSRRSPEGEGGS